MRARIRAFVALVCALGSLPMAAASSRGTPYAGLPVMNLYTADVHGGGPQTFDVAQDAHGILYFGNLHGLLTFDGVWWRMIALPDEQPALAVATNQQGRVALGMFEDFGYLESDAIGRPLYRSLLPLLPEKLRTPGSVTDLCSTRRGFVYVAEKRIVLWTGREVRVVAEQDPNALIHGCTVSGDALLLRGPGGLRVLNLETLRMEQTAIRRRVSRIFRRPDGEVILAIRDEGLFRLVDGRLVAYAPEASEWLKRGRIVTGGAILGDGRLVIGTRQHEVLILSPDGTIEQILGEAARIPDAVINDVFVDAEGAVWLAMEGPIVRIDLNSPVSAYDARLGIKGSVGDVARLKDDLYIASSHGVYRVDAAGAQALPGFPTGAWRLLEVDGDLLVALVDKVVRVRPSGTPEEILNGTGAIYDVIRSPADPSRVWVGSEHRPIALRRSAGRWTKERDVAVELEGMNTIVERFGVLWCGTSYQGVVRIENPLSDRPRITTYGDNEMNVFEVDGRLVIVRATDGAVLQPVDRAQADGTIAHVLEPDPSFGKLSVPGGFFVMAQDAGGDVWLNSRPPRFLRRRADGGFDLQARPVPAITSTDIQNIRAQQDGRVWFSTSDGLFCYDRQRVARLETSRPPLIRQVTTVASVLFGGNPDRSTIGASLKSGFGRIRFEFAPGTVTPGVAYQHRLDPVEREWSEWTETPSIDYTTLSPGTYRFRLRSRNPTGNASAETSWSFTVLPPWYRTPLAYVLWSVLAIALIVLIIHFRTRALHRQAENLRARVHEQTVKLEETVALLEDANRDLKEAQEKIARFNESSGEALRDVRTWSRDTAIELASSIHASQIAVFIATAGELVPISATDVRPPRLEELENLPHKHTPIPSGDGQVTVPVPGLTGKVFGALVVTGKAQAWTDAERQLISTFAHQLGGALELQQVRADLAEARERNVAVRRQMTERGIELLAVCPLCSRCYEEERRTCLEDGSPLDSTRVLPFRIASRYRLMRVLGSGGMGEVFSARDERLERDVAVKVIKSGHLSSDARSRFDREARAVARIQHPNVVAIFDSGELEEGSAYIVTELLEGCDLNHVLRRHGRGAPAQVASLLRQGAAALHAAHAAGLVHRDVKPANLFLVNTAAGFDLKLVDFGIAKSLDLDAQLTQSGTLIGTPAYMAPEQVTRGRADARTDLYSFAAVVYEALVGVRVSGTASGFAALWDVMSTSAAPPSRHRPSLTAAIDAAFDVALAKIPGDRPADLVAWADALATEMERVRDAEPGWPHPLLKIARDQYSTQIADAPAGTFIPTTPVPPPV